MTAITETGARRLAALVCDGAASPEQYPVTRVTGGWAFRWLASKGPVPMGAHGAVVTDCGAAGRLRMCETAEQAVQRLAEGSQTDVALCGLALLPEQETMRRIVDFRQSVGALIGGPPLGMRSRMPHVTVMQALLRPGALTSGLLSAMASAWMSRPVSPFALGPLYSYPVDWAFVAVRKWRHDLRLYHLDVLRCLGPLVQRDAIRPEPDANRIPPAELAAHNEHGYRYAGDVYRPHITLGRLAPTAPGGLAELWARSMEGHEFTFERLVFYRAGESGVLAEVLAETILP